MSELVTDINALILAVSSLLGVIGTLVVAVAAKLNAGKAKEIATKVGEGLKETDKWVLENEQKLVTTLEVAYKLAPEEAKVAAAKYQELIVKYNGDLNAVKEELRRLYGVVDVPE